MVPVIIKYHVSPTPPWASRQVSQHSQHQSLQVFRQFSRGRSEKKQAGYEERLEYSFSVCAFFNFDYSDHFYSPVTDRLQKKILKFT